MLNLLFFYRFSGFTHHPIRQRRIETPPAVLWPCRRPQSGLRCPGAAQQTRSAAEGSAPVDG